MAINKNLTKCLEKIMLFSDSVVSVTRRKTKSINPWLKEGSN